MQNLSFFNIEKTFLVNLAFRFNYMIISFYLVKIVVNHLHVINIKKNCENSTEL